VGGHSSDSVSTSQLDDADMVAGIFLFLCCLSQGVSHIATYGPKMEILKQKEGTSTFGIKKIYIYYEVGSSIS
jgi:hypothetical protein